MKQSVMLRYRYVALFLFLVPMANIEAAKIWNNNLAISEPSAFAPVVDESLDIQGINELISPVHIAAINADVLVTVTNSDSLITSSLQLYMFAAASRKITFSLSNDLVFRGSQSDFLITFSGGGTLEFLLAGDTRLSFTSEPTTGGAIFVVNMDASAIPTVRFSRTFPGGTIILPNDNAFVEVGARSAITFVSQASLNTGATANMFFDAANGLSNSGRLILQLDDGGAFVISGHRISTFADPVLANISFGIPAGQNANVELITSNTAGFSGLMVINYNTIWPQLLSDPFCEGVLTTTPTLAGYILGANGTLTLDDGTYLDYVGTVTNRTLTPAIPVSITQGRLVDTIIKDRNPSAFIVDGNPTSAIATDAQIVMGGSSAVYFRSGTNKNGDVVFQVFDPVVGDVVISFTVDPSLQFTGRDGYGSIVFDVEGRLNVIGDATTNANVLNILSLQVTPTGGSVLIEQTDVRFPLRTFRRISTASSAYLQYGISCFLINNRVNLFNAVLQHTDELHQIFEKNFPEESQAAYIGGERHKLNCDVTAQRPKFTFYNSKLLMHTSGAFTGVDLFIPDGNTPLNESLINTSSFIFYQNGYCIDSGTGRQLILGTDIGALASDLGTVIDREAQLDVFQEHMSPSPIEELDLLTAPNNNKITQGLTITGTPIANQFSVHTIYQGHNTNISIGLDPSMSLTPFAGLLTQPLLFINGNFFSFETQGGDVNQPECSMATGVGGIFVDRNATIEIADFKRANVGTVVTRSLNGIINLPRRQVFFDKGIGIAQWALNLTDTSQLVIIDANQQLSDYTLDWRNVTKNYCNGGGFVPFELPDTPFPCNAPFVANANLTSLPTVRGLIQQMQIKNSRLGDQVHLLIDGGIVEELVMLDNPHDSSDAPVGFIVLQNDAELGLGTAHRNLDSDKAQVVLGINGIELVANGDAQVFLNEDTLINNVCHIITGTAFGLTGAQTLRISSEVPRELRIATGGVLDLSSFINPNQNLVIAGEVSVVLEPGATVILNGGNLNFAETAQVSVQPFVSATFTGTALTDADFFRVKFIGNGNVLFTENSSIDILRGAALGIETGPITTFVSPNETGTSCSNVTTQTWSFFDQSKLQLGSAGDFGGVFQIGNTSDKGGSIDFNLTLNGIGALFEVNSQGFLGLGAGAVNKPDQAANNWTIARLFNVNSITLNFTQGILQHNQIYPGSDPLAGLIAIGSVGSFNNTVIDPVNSQIRGGGNLVLLTADGVIAPTVLTTDGVVSSSLSVGILGSKSVLRDGSKAGTLPASASPTQLFNFLKANPYAVQHAKRAQIGQDTLGQATIGWINQSTIVRQPSGQIIGDGGSTVSFDRSLTIGAVGITLDSSGAITEYEIATTS